MYNSYAQTMSDVNEAQRAFFYKVYGWMAAALALTGIIAMQVASSTTAIRFIYGNPGVIIGLILAELALVFVLSMALNKLSPAVAMVMFFVYAALNGLTMSAIFLAYTKASIASTFMVTGGTFAIMSAYGYFTKKDLSSWGNLLFMGLIGIIIASVVNIFLHNSAIYWIITYVGVLIFVGLTAYDTNKLKKICANLQEGTDAYTKVAIIGALQLYLDFINLFLMLLRIMGRRLEVDSREGVGTCFSLYLPRAGGLPTDEPDPAIEIEQPAADTTSTTASPASAPAPAVDKGTIMVVDDEEHMLRLSRDILERLGYDVLTCAEAPAAVDLFTARAADIDLVVLDLLLPRMGGDEVFDHIKAARADVRVLLISGSKRDPRIADLLARGCDEFLQKPFSMEDLGKAVRALLDRE